jgi:hypothetical protein
MRRSIVIGAATLALTMVAAAPAVATECFNASKKDQTAGAQIVLGPNGILYVTEGLLNRFDQGLVDPDTGEGFHGVVAFDFDGDGQADFTTWAGVGPDGEEIPLEAQFRGPACRGLTNIGIYLEQCVGA